jgi:hypothetical protein
MSYAISRKGVKIGMEMAGSILAHALFVLKLPVALASRITFRQGCSTQVMSSRHKMAGTRTWDKCYSVF